MYLATIYRTKIDPSKDYKWALYQELPPETRKHTLELIDIEIIPATTSGSYVQESYFTLIGKFKKVSRSW